MAVNNDIVRASYSIVTISLKSSSLDALNSLLCNKIDPNAQAYYNRAVILDISEIYDLKSIDYFKIKQCLQEHNLFLIGVSGLITEDDVAFMQAQDIPVVNANKFAKAREENLEPKVIVKTLKVQVPIEKQIPYEVKVPVEIETHAPLKMVHRNIRSGETIAANGNSVVIFGSVNAGSRIIASHNVIIFGDVKGGQIFAGNPKDQYDPGYEDAIISVSGQFNPAFVAIAGNYQTAEDMEKDPLIGPIANNCHEIVVSLQGRSLRYSKFKEFANLR